jgi:hypothetical protein
MRVLKIICALGCLFSAARFVQAIHGMHSAQTGSMVIDGTLGMIWLLVMALIYAVEFYGIHTKAPFAWKLGWGILAATFLQFLVLGGSSALKLPEADYPWVAFASVVVGGSLVAIYWGFWWNRQKNYFTPQSRMIPNTRTKELAAVLCISAVVLAVLTLLSGPAARNTKLANQAVKQFHDQLDAGQYAVIYDGADETLRETTSESDFVNLLQSVHQKLGNVQDLNLSGTGIAWHGGQGVTISLIYDTKFTHGTGNERFVWQNHDNRVTLGRYHIKSNVLTSK